MTECGANLGHTAAYLGEALSVPQKLLRIRNELSQSPLHRRWRVLRVLLQLLRIQGILCEHMTEKFVLTVPFGIKMKV
jgi:hypothetical protein